MIRDSLENNYGVKASSSLDKIEEDGSSVCSIILEYLDQKQINTYIISEARQKYLKFGLKIQSLKELQGFRFLALIEIFWIVNSESCSVFMMEVLSQLSIKRLKEVNLAPTIKKEVAQKQLESKNME